MNWQLWAAVQPAANSALHRQRADWGDDEVAETALRGQGSACWAAWIRKGAAVQTLSAKGPLSGRLLTDPTVGRPLSYQRWAFPPQTRLRTLSRLTHPWGWPAILGGGQPSLGCCPAIPGLLSPSDDVGRARLSASQLASYSGSSAHVRSVSPPPTLVLVPDNNGEGGPARRAHDVTQESDCDAGGRAALR
jgi:hypothetical protein